MKVLSLIVVVLVLPVLAFAQSTDTGIGYDQPPTSTNIAAAVLTP